MNIDNSTPQERSAQETHPNFQVIRRINRHRFWEVELSDGRFVFYPKRLWVGLSRIQIIAVVDTNADTTANYDLVENWLNANETIELMNLLIHREAAIRAQKGGAS